MWTLIFDDSAHSGMRFCRILLWNPEKDGFGMNFVADSLDDELNDLLHAGRDRPDSQLRTQCTAPTSPCA